MSHFGENLKPRAAVAAATVVAALGTTVFVKEGAAIMRQAGEDAPTEIEPVVPVTEIPVSEPAEGSGAIKPAMVRVAAEARPANIDIDAKEVGIGIAGLAALSVGFALRRPPTYKAPKLTSRNARRTKSRPESIDE